MSPLQQHDRLREIREEIERLDAKLIDDKRAAGGLVGLADGDAVGRAEAEVIMTRLKLDALLREHLRISEALLMVACPIHPVTAYIASCPDCQAVWGPPRSAA